MFHILCSVIAENLVKEVNKKIFHGLVNLKTLSLYSNKISCVTPGAFDALGKNNLSEIFNLIVNSFSRDKKTSVPQSLKWRPQFWHVLYAVSVLLSILYLRDGKNITGIGYLRLCEIGIAFPFRKSTSWWTLYSIILKATTDQPVV